MYEIIFSDEALFDLWEIYHFIAIDNEYIADKVNTNILMCIQNLSFFPKLWVDIWDDSRELIESVYRYQIRYKTTWNTIQIIAIYKFKNI